MRYFTQAVAWLFEPERLGGANPLPLRTWEHLWYSLLSVAIACIVAIPAGWYIGHRRRGRTVVVALTGAARALPTLGLITLLGILLGIGLVAPLTAFVILAIPSVLAGAYSGVEAVNPVTVDAARGQGFTEWQILTRVEVPLGLPLLVGGIRSAVLQVVATATLAAYVGAGGLGRYLFLGLKTQDYVQMIAGSIMVVVVALLLDLMFAALQRFATPAGVSHQVVTGEENQ